MRTHKVVLVTVIAETILGARIKADIQEMGSSGITVTNVQGEGSRNLHAGEIPGEKIKMECIVDAPLAAKILEHISENYFDNFSVIAYTQEAEVLRAEKFRRPPSR